MPKGILQSKDLTTGPVFSALMCYMIPMLVSMFFQQAYNLADGWIAGTQIGSAALGAVSTCYPLTVFFIAMSSGLSMGTSLYCSQRLGAKRTDQVKAGITTAFLYLTPLSLAVMLLGELACPGVLVWLEVPAQAMEATLQYLRVYIAGIPFLFLYNLSTAVLNGLGNSQMPLICLIVSCLANIALDFVFILALPWGVAGLALATVLAQAAAAAAAVWAAVRLYRSLKGPAGRRFDPEAMGSMLRLGLPSMLQHMVMSVGQMSMQSLVNSYGLAVMAGYSVSFRINGLVTNTMMALSNALSGYIAQNLGAKQYDRIRRGTRLSIEVCYAFSVCVILLLLWQGEGIVSLFLRRDDPLRSEILAAGMGFIRIVSPFYLVVCLKVVFDGALRGIGAMLPFLCSTISDVVVRLVAGKPFSQCWGLTGVWCVWPTAWLVGTGISVASYYYFKSIINQRDS